MWSALASASSPDQTRPKRRALFVISPPPHRTHFWLLCDEKCVHQGSLTVGWNTGPRSWKELHRRLSDGRPRNVPPGAEGDSPAWSRRRQPYEPPNDLHRTLDTLHVPYAELHCHSAYSFWTAPRIPSSSPRKPRV